MEIVKVICQVIVTIVQVVSLVVVVVKYHDDRRNK